ncbi:MAG TPA: hypothetical protein VFJ74_03140, partial [Gemmatimonadaceae bacterium]|nr:hypothetical protein [Gemmatimonadaceae bacterium]
MTTALPPARPPRGILSRLLSRRAAPAAPLTSAQAERQLFGPIRGELLGAEGLAERAREVARGQRLLPAPSSAREARRRAGRGGGPLFRRLAETQEILEEARDSLTQAADRGADVSPAGDWLLDNFYVVEEHIRETRESMPVGYYAELPKLASGTLVGYPRIYEVAIELIAHTEGRLTLDNIETFVSEFQRVTPLTIGELWAIPAMLRLGLIENVRRLGLRTTQWLRDVEQADEWAERLHRAAEGANGADGAEGSGLGANASSAGVTAIDTAMNGGGAIRPLDPSHALATALAEFVNGHPPLTPAFVTRFLQLIRTTQSSFTPLVWLEQWIAEDGGLTAEDAASRSNQRLALTQVMMANSITSLRTIARLDWKTLVEAQSVLERALRADPTGDYGAMSFGGRDHYRHVVEHIAKRT